MTPSPMSEFPPRWIEEHAALVYRVAYQVLGSEADAEDACQEVFLKIAEQGMSKQVVVDTRAYLARTAINTALSMRRAAKRRRVREERKAMQSSKSALDPERRLALQELLALVAMLPEDVRLPLVLHFQEGFTYDEIARILGCPLGTVASRISTARGELRTRWTAGAAIGMRAEGAWWENALREAAPEVPSELTERLCQRVEQGLPRSQPGWAWTVSGGVGLLVLCGAAIYFVSAAKGWYGPDGREERAGIAAQGEKPARATQETPGPGGAARLAAAGARKDSLDSASVPASPEPEAAPDVVVVEGGVPGDSAATASGHALYRIFGTIQDENGRPIAGAKVSVTQEIGGAFASAHVSGAASPAQFTDETAADGTYEILFEADDLEAPPTGVASALGTVAGGGSTGGGSSGGGSSGGGSSGGGSSGGDVPEFVTSIIESLDPAETASALDTSLSPAAPEGAPAASDGELLGQQSQTMEEPRSYLQVSASKAGYLCAARAPLYFEQPEERRIDLQLHSGSELEGRVVDSSGAGIRGARVWLAAGNFDPELGQLQEEAPTDEQGYFHFEYFPKGKVTLRVSARDEGYQDAEQRVRERDPPVIQLQRGCEIGLSVTGEGQIPLTNARVELWQGGECVAQRSTEPDGRLRWQGLTPGEYELRVHNPSRDMLAYQERVTLNTERVLERAIELPLCGTIRGSIRVAPEVQNLGTWLDVMLVSSASNQGAGTFQYHTEGCTRDKPEFEFVDVPPGEYRLYLTNFVKSVEEGVVAECCVTVPPGGGVVRTELVVEELPSAKLLVRVLDVDGKELKASIRAERNPFGYRIDSAEARADTPTQLQGFPGDWRVIAEASGFRTRQLASLTLAAGEARSISMTLDALNPAGQSSASLFPNENRIYVNGRTSVRALFQLLEDARGAPFSYGAELYAKGVAGSDCLEKECDPLSYGGWPATALFEMLLDKYHLAWRLDGVSVWIEPARDSGE